MTSSMRLVLFLCNCVHSEIFGTSNFQITIFIFRLILIAEKDKVYEEFPTPLINRLEKHFVVTSTVLTENQKQLLEEVKTWANKYACVKLVIIDFFILLCSLIAC